MKCSVCGKPVDKHSMPALIECVSTLIEVTPKNSFASAYKIGVAENVIDPRSGQLSPNKALTTIWVKGIPRHVENPVKEVYGLIVSKPQKKKPVDPPEKPDKEKESDDE